RRTGIRPDLAQRRRVTGALRRLVPADAGPALLLDGAWDPAPDRVLLDAPARLTPRAGLDRDSRGRDGGRRDGHPADADEDLGLRDWRLLRRHRRRVRRQLQLGGLSQPVRL